LKDCIWLGIETSSRPGSVAAVSTGGLESQILLDEEVSTSESLLPALEQLLDRLGVSGREISGIGNSLGPGSYTGLRIGAATAMGLSAGWGVPLKGVPTLRAIAVSASSDGPVMAAIRARDGEVFAAVYASSGIHARELMPQGVYETSAVRGWLDRGAVCAGPGASMIAPGDRITCTDVPGAAAIARIAAELFDLDGADRVLRPLYLRSFRQKASTGVR
jgi:tRNA threonylcarbamoyladenosine biosynthesis protein TsaB